MSVNTTLTVRELAISIPGATRVFEQMGIDYCCGGGRTLADACLTSNARLEEVLRRLQAASQAIKAGDKLRDWQAESLTSLSTHIAEEHHAFTKRELTRLEQLMEKVCAKHGENHPELAELRSAFEHLSQDLTPHMLKEEQVLFPYIARMEEAVDKACAVPAPFFVSVQNPVRMMMNEHDRAGELLSQMRGITGNYSAPADACISFRTLYEALGELEADLHQHIHLENNILFPRAVEMETAARPASQRAGQEFGVESCFGH
jgi:regulator of cell morphogenesis and NO signaling